MEIREHISSVLLLVGVLNFIGFLIISWRLGQLVRALGGG